MNIFITVSALLLLLPLLLEYESFGLVDPHDVALSRERLAAATSMVSGRKKSKEEKDKKVRNR